VRHRAERRRRAAGGARPGPAGGHRHGYGPLRRLVTWNCRSPRRSSSAGCGRRGVRHQPRQRRQLIGVSSLGYLFIDGLQRSFPTEIYVGLVLVIALALACDLILVAIRRAVTRGAGMSERRGG